MKIELKIDTSREKKQGFPLIISIYKNIHDRKYPFTGYYSKLEDWDFDKNEPKISHPEYDSLIDYVLETKVKINKIKRDIQKSATTDYVKNQLFGTSTDFYNFWEVRIQEEKNEGQKTIYQNSLNEFRSYRKHLEFQDIDYAFLQGFKLSKKDSCTSGGINTYLAKIRAVYNEGIRRGIFLPTSFISPFNKIMEKSEKTKNKHFGIDEVKKIYEKPEKTTYDYYFLLCFFLGGLDFVDIANLKKSNIKKGRIQFTRFKGNTNEFIDNFIFPEAKEILNYFSNDSEYLTDIYKYSSIKDRRDNYNSRYRDQLKALGIESYFTTKTPRYSFIHIGNRELLLNRDVIMSLVGHARNDTHSIYEGAFSNKIKDETHRKIIDSVIKLEDESSEIVK